MTLALAHRGPDGRGCWFDPDLGWQLGHTRLSIMDPTSRSAQPMTCRSGRYTIVFNGEIYNFRALAAQLRRAGVEVRSSGDTEVLLETISLLGISSALKSLEGMFAFAVVDKQTHQLHLARDRFGQKPLYWFKQGDRFAFASELKGLLSLRRAAWRVNPDAVADLLEFGFIPSPQSILRDVHKVEPGTILTVDASLNLTSRQFWSLEHEASKASEVSALGLEDAADRLDSMLEEAVNNHATADTEVGCFLSGGLDSSLIAVMLARRKTRFKTFSIGFTEAAWDETEKAAEVSRFLGSDHHHLSLSANVGAELVTSLADVYDEPFADFSQLPTLALSRFARTEVRVCLSGDGGDELFGGYDRYNWCRSYWRNLHASNAADRGRRRSRSSVRWLRSERGRTVPSDIAALLRETSEFESFEQFYRLVLRRGGVSLLDGTTFANSSVPYWPAGRDWSLLQRMRVADIRHYMGDGILTKVDRASMSCGLEVRAPFLAEVLRHLL